MRYKTLTTLLITLTLLSLIVYLPHEVSAQSWLGGWEYRRAITISNSLTQELSEYQIKLVIDTASLISAGKLQSTCADLRFTDSDGVTLLNYWIESGCNTSETVVWVRVPNIPASSSKTIYMYYGNPNAQPMSSGESTFIFFDDFTTLSSDWGLVPTPRTDRSNPSFSVVDGWLRLYGSNVAGGVYYKNPISVTPNGYALESVVLLVSYPGNAAFYFLAVHDTLDNASTYTIGLFETGAVSSGTHRWVLRTYVGYTDTGVGISANVVYRVSLRLTPSVQRLEVYNVVTTSRTDSVSLPSPMYLQLIRTDVASYTVDYRVDWVAIRHYVDPEPTATVSDIEEVPTPTPTIYVGMPVTLEINTTLAPGDAVAPHLYDVFLDGIDDYIVIQPFTVYGWNEITIEQWVKIPFPQYRYAKTSHIGDNWVDYPVIALWCPGDSNAVQAVFDVRKPDGTKVMYRAVVATSTIRNDVWIQHVTRFTSTREVSHWVDSSKLYSASVPAEYKTILEWDPNNATYPERYRRFVLGANVLFGEYMKVSYGYVLIYDRALQDTEINNSYTYKLVNASGLKLFFDPTFYNGTHFLDLSGNNNHGVGYGGVSRIPTENMWLYTVKALHNDNYIHFRFFPVNTYVEVYDSSGSLVTNFTILGSVNGVGLVEDFTISLPQGDYLVRVYTYVDRTVYQNHDTTYYSYIPRYAPQTYLRVMWDVGNASQAHYQLSSDPNFSTVLYEETLPVSANYVDIQLPQQNNTYYLRLRLQVNEVWGDWSNTVSFRVDYPVVQVSSIRTDIFSPTAIPYSITYTDGSAPIFTGNYSVVVQSLGTYSVADVWWRVDVYSGATSSAEPPDPTYYTYLGTVYPISTHTFFSSTSVPGRTVEEHSFILDVGINQAPYWAKTVGSPDVNFALVYQAYVYLPLTGTYTFRIYSDDGVRLYINGSLVIDGWGGVQWPASASIDLVSGWYNITIKYWQAGGHLSLVVDVTLPNGTVVRPLRPAYGVLIRPVDDDYTPTLPQPGLQLLPKPITSSSGSLIHNLGVVGSLNITLYVKDFATGLDVTISSVSIWDCVYVKSFTPSSPRFTIGDVPTFDVVGVYAFDDTPHQGTYILNDTSTKTSVGTYTYAIIGITDDLYGLTRFTGNLTTTVIFDKLIIDEYFVNAINKSGTEVTITNNTRVDYKSSIKAYVRLRHAFDGLEVTSGTVTLFNVSADYVGGYWVSTITTTAVGMRTYDVVTSAQSDLNVRFVDTSPKFTVVWDALVTSFVSVDVVSEVGTVRLTYTTDGVVTDGVVGFLGINTTEVSTVDGLANISIRGFDMNITSPHTAYGIVDASGLVWSPYQNTSVPLYKTVFDSLSIKHHNPITILYYLNLSGYVHVRYEVRGDTAINVTATAVLVNGRPYPLIIRDGHTVLYDLSSTVDVYYTQPSEVLLTSYVSAPGFDVEVGLADTNNVSSAMFKAGILINSTTYGSSVFVWYNGSVVASKDMLLPSPPVNVLLSYYCESESMFVIYAGFIYVEGTYTKMVTDYVKASVTSCPVSLYPYVYSPTTSVFVERYGNTLGMTFRLMTVGDIRVSIVGPVIPGSLLKYVYVTSPLAIEYALTDVNVYPYGAKGVTLKGFRGWTLSYSVAGVTISGVTVTADEYVVDVPIGITLVVSVDPTGRSISLVSASPPPVVTTVTAPTVTPVINLPDYVVFRPTVPQLSSILMYGVFLALTLAMYSLTRSLSTAVVVSGVVSSIYAFASKDLSILPYTAVAITLGIALYISARE